MPDLPLDERALREAQLVIFTEFGTTREAVSTYLRKAGFEIEHDDGKLDFSLGKQGPRQRLVSPWLPIDREEES